MSERDVSQLPPLTKREHRLLAEAEPRVREYAQYQCRKTGVEEDELHQAGMEACLREVRDYVDNDEVPFFGFAFAAVRGAMLEASRKERRPRDLAQSMLRGSIEHTKGVVFGDVLFEEAAHRRKRLDDAIHTQITSMMLTSLTRPPTPEDELADRQRQQVIRDELESALAPFPPEDRELFKAHKLEELPLAEAARRVGMEYEKARRRFENAMEAVVHWFSTRKVGGVAIRAVLQPSP